jgi:hypothetical protein
LNAVEWRILAPHVQTNLGVEQLHMPAIHTEKDFRPDLAHTAGIGPEDGAEVKVSSAVTGENGLTSRAKDSEFTHPTGLSP